ncbi:hypothetical protein ACFL04_00300 [Patescibacteria group bacterium]
MTNKKGAEVNFLKKALGLTEKKGNGRGQATRSNWTASHHDDQPPAKIEYDPILRDQVVSATETFRGEFDATNVFHRLRQRQISFSRTAVRQILAELADESLLRKRITRKRQPMYRC